MSSNLYKMGLRTPNFSQRVGVRKSVYSTAFFLHVSVYTLKIVNPKRVKIN